MYIAMNRFKINLGEEDAFIEMWKNRDSLLNEVSGFKEFHLLQGETTEEHTLFSSYASWESEDHFRAWTKSDAFKKAHSSSGSGERRNVFAGPPQLETFDVVL